jgi:hypothetical protein
MSNAFRTNRLQLVVQDSATASSPQLGDVIVDSSDSKAKTWNGSQWVEISSVPKLVQKGDIYTRSSTTDTRQPVGSNGTVLSANSATFTGLEWINQRDPQKINPNFIMNGNFDFWQRGTSFTNLTSNTFVSDRWRADIAAAGAGQQANCSVTRQESSDKDGSRHHLRITKTTANCIMSDFAIRQPIETGMMRPLTGRTVTVSFWCRTNRTSIRTELDNRNNAAGGSLRTQISTVTPNTWTKIVFTTFIAGTIAYTGVDTSLNGQLIIGFETNRTSGTLITNGDYLDVSEVKLEIGDQATPFCLAGKTLANEEFLCLRYYENSYNRGVPVATSTYIGTVSFQAGENTLTPNPDLRISVPVAVKRATSTVTYRSNDGTLNAVTVYTGGNGVSQNRINGGSVTIEVVSRGNSSFSIRHFEFIGGVSRNGFLFHYEYNSELL